MHGADLLGWTRICGERHSFVMNILGLTSGHLVRRTDALLVISGSHKYEATGRYTYILLNPLSHSLIWAFSVDVCHCQSKES